MIRPKAPAPGPSPHDSQAVVKPAPGAVGQVQAVKLRRRSRKHPEILLFRGDPASKLSIARSVEVTIVPPNGEVPAPWIDREKGRIHLFYPSLDHPDVVALTRNPGTCACYLWTSGDGKQSHAWLVTTR